MRVAGKGDNTGLPIRMKISFPVVMSLASPLLLAACSSTTDIQFPTQTGGTSATGATGGGGEGGSGGGGEGGNGAAGGSPGNSLGTATAVDIDPVECFKGNQVIPTSKCY